jgi:hypothetical protein
MANPHDLINLPGAGNAEKALRKAGLWLLTPEEKLSRAIDDLIGSIEATKDFADTLEYQWRKMEAKE